MSRPLSIFTYFFRNKRKVIPVIFILGFSILATTAASAITSSIIREANSYINIYNRFTTIFYDPARSQNTNSKQLKTELEAIKEVERVYTIQTRFTSMIGVIGPSVSSIYFSSNADQESFIKDIGWKLNQGRLPKANTNEVALTENLLRNKNLKIGDKVGSDIQKDERLQGAYTIVGSFTTQEIERLSGIGSLEYMEVNSKDSETRFMVKNVQNHRVIEDIKSVSKKYQGVVYDFAWAQKESEGQFDTLNQIVMAIVTIVVVVIVIAVSLLNIIFLMQRANEFGLFAAIGYSKSFIIMKTLQETVVQALLGWFIGILITQGVYMLLNNLIYTPKGIEELTIFELRTITFSLPVPFAVAICSIITIIAQLWRMDPISVIERRD